MLPEVVSGRGLAMKRRPSLLTKAVLGLAEPPERALLGRFSRSHCFTAALASLMTRASIPIAFTRIRF